jgi:hypothetical protein
LLFNRLQGLDCTWPRLGSASQVCFENSPALRTLTTSTFKSEEEEEKGSLPACPSWVVSACLATYIGYVPCVSNRPCQRWYSHHHNTFLTSFKYSESCVQNSKKICCKLCGKYAANLLPYRRWRVTSNSAQGQQPRGHPGKPRQAPMYVANRGRRGGILEPRTFAYRPACCLTK